jgi:mannan endo-1,4-beta-mannosidase
MTIYVSKSRFTFIGTNAYWLHTLNTDEDIDKTLADISATGVKVVRTWAFNGLT